MMEHFKAQPNASYYEMLLRAALKCPDAAMEVYNEAQGHVDDFRVLALLRKIAECHEREEKMTPPGIIQWAQGKDFQQWLLDMFWELPEADIVKHRQYWQDAIVGLKRAKAQKMIDAATVAAHRALKDGNQGRYKELLADMQNLRREIKKINY